MLCELARSSCDDMHERFASRFVEQDVRVTFRRSSVPQTNLSKKADYRILASSTGRAGDSVKAAVSHYNLGVVADNAFRFKRAIECYKKFIAALKSASKDQNVAATMLSARVGGTGTSPLLSSRTSRSAAGASARAPADLGASYTSQASTVPSDTAVRSAQALGYNALAISAAAAGDLEAALLYHAEHAKVAPHPQGRVIALVNAGIVHRHLQNFDDSDACFQGALKLAISQRDDAGEMLAAGHLGLNAVVPLPLPLAGPKHATPPSNSILSPSKPAPPVEGAPAARPHRFVRGRPAPSAAAGSAAGSSTAAGTAASGSDGSAPQQRRMPRCLTLEPLALDRAKEALSTLLQLHAKGDDPRNVCRGHSALGTIAFAKGLLQDAAAHYNEASVRGREAGEGPRADLDRCHLGMALASQQMQAYVAALGQGAKAVANMQLPRDVPAVAAVAALPPAGETTTGMAAPGAASHSAAVQ